MALFSTPLCLVAFILIIALGVLSRIFGGKIALALSLVNIVLHIAIAPLLLFSGGEFIELSIVYLSSFLVITISHYVIRRIRRDV